MSTALMNRALAVVLIALALCAGFVGGLAAGRYSHVTAPVAAGLSPAERANTIAQCYQVLAGPLPSSEAVAILIAQQREKQVQECISKAEAAR